MLAWLSASIETGFVHYIFFCVKSWNVLLVDRVFIIVYWWSCGLVLPLGVPAHNCFYLLGPASSHRVVETLWYRFQYDTWYRYSIASTVSIPSISVLEEYRRERDYYSPFSSRSIGAGEIFYGIGIETRNITCPYWVAILCGIHENWGFFVKYYCRLFSLYSAGIC